jgi:16S rRNA U516 pseudouridylate synthase RsuA-like enzyme
MRHQTTGYDSMVIPLVKGRRREVRRMLAQRSVQLLARYRQGQALEVATCPLARALAPHRPKPAAPANPQGEWAF